MNIFTALGRLLCDWGYRLLKRAIAHCYGYELTVLPTLDAQPPRDTLYDDDEVDALLRGEIADYSTQHTPAVHAPQAPQLPPALLPPLTYCPMCLPFGSAAPRGRTPHYCWLHSTAPAAQELAREQQVELSGMSVLTVPYFAVQELRRWIPTERRANECN